MQTQTLRLVYPPSLLRQPIVNQLIRRFDLTVNILQAHITLDEGWLEVQLSGDGSVIRQAVDWLVTEGIAVETLG